MTEHRVNPLQWLSTKFASINHSHNEYVNPTIVDNLTTDDNTKVLSAKQGQVLKTSLDGKADSVHNHDDRYYTELEIVDFLNKKIDLDCEFINGYWNTNNPNSIIGASVKDTYTLRHDGKTFIYKVPDFSSMTYSGDLYLRIATTNYTNGIVGRIYHNDQVVSIETAKTLILNKYVLFKHIQNGTFDEYHVLDIFNIFHNHNDVYYSKSEIDNKIITDVSGLTDNQGLLFSGDYDDLTDKPNIPSSSSDLTDGSNIIKKSSTNGLIKNDGSIDTNTYLTSSSLNGYEQTSNKVTSLDSFSTDTEYPSAKAVYDELWTNLYGTIQSEYVQSNDLSTVAFSNDYEDLDNLPQLGNLAFENDVDLSGHDLDELSDNTNLLFSGNYNDLTNKPSYTPTITSSTTGAYKIGSINVSGSNVDIYGKDIDTVYTHPTYSNVEKSTSAIYKFKTNSLGHIIEISTVSASDLPSHTHDDRYYTETEVDTVLENKISKSQTVGLVKNDGSIMTSGTGSNNWTVGNDLRLSDKRKPIMTVVTPDSSTDIDTYYTETGFYAFFNNSAVASMSTENKAKLPTGLETKSFYLIVENRGNYAKQTLTRYDNNKTWIRIRNADRTTPWSDWSELSVDGHTHTISDVDDLNNQLSTKAPTSHASSSTTYGVATSSNYGHTKVINNLTTSSNNNGEALSAYQGKVLNDNKLARDSIDSVEGTEKNNSLYNCISFYSGEGNGQVTKGNDTVILQCVGHNSVFLLDMNKLKSVIDFNDADEYKICDFSSVGSSQFSDDGTTYSTFINGGKIYGSVLNGKLLISIYDNNNNEILYTDVNSMPPYVYIHMQTNQSVMQMTMSNIDNIIGLTDINAIANIVYPVGSIYMSMSSTSPQTLFGGRWEQLKDRFLLGVGDTYSADSTGGSATVTLTASQSGVPAHSHKYNDYNTTYTLKTTNRKPGTSTAVAYGTSLTAGGGATERTSSNNTTANASQAHENMPPYLTVYMWKRTA